MINSNFIKFDANSLSDFTNYWVVDFYGYS